MGEVETLTATGKGQNANAGLRPNYGIDAPAVIGRLFAIGIVGLGLGAVSVLIVRTGKLPWPKFVSPSLLAMGLPLVTTACVMLWGSKVGKLRLRAPGNRAHS